MNEVEHLKDKNSDIYFRSWWRPNIELKGESNGLIMLPCVCWKCKGAKRCKLAAMSALKGDYMSVLCLQFFTAPKLLKKSVNAALRFWKKQISIYVYRKFQKTDIKHLCFEDFACFSFFKYSHIWIFNFLTFLERSITIPYCLPCWSVCDPHDAINFTQIEYLTDNTCSWQHHSSLLPLNIMDKSMNPASWMASCKPWTFLMLNCACLQSVCL